MAAVCPVALQRPCPKFPLMARLLPTYLLSDDSPEGHAVVLMKVGGVGMHTVGLHAGWRRFVCAVVALAVGRGGGRLVVVVSRAWHDVRRQCCLRPSLGGQGMTSALLVPPPGPC
jgi:hypothetical protein